ncbi:hypothetical protein [Algoriphagus confluentis]|uniref:Uncharacterized protein n=1 Tax=Algoriphagus confluentis TaxID=1697556 RepID=A0ABQ6PRI5_9BACT|nr:hypothetical protein Aconfl_32620 [Algoriphagus confluentis]
MKKYFIIIFVIMFVVFFIIKIAKIYPINIANNSLCKSEELAKKEMFFGEVVDKFHDKENHNYKAILIENGLGVHKSYIFDLDWNNGFEKVSVGDSIAKDLDILIVCIFKKDGTKIVAELDYNCR